MADFGPRSYRYGAIKRQLQRGVNEHERHVRQAWIDRVLQVLDSDHLIGQAAAGQATDQDLLFDCNVAPLVWDDPRIAYRRQQLESSDIKVELIDHQSEIAGKTFRRARIRVTFSD